MKSSLIEFLLVIVFGIGCFVGGGELAKRQHKSDPQPEMPRIFLCNDREGGFAYADSKDYQVGTNHSGGLEICITNLVSFYGARPICPYCGAPRNQTK